MDLAATASAAAGSKESVDGVLITEVAGSNGFAEKLTGAFETYEPEPPKAVRSGGGAARGIAGLTGRILPKYELLPTKPGD